MKTLILMRHGKSDWSGQGSSDFDRPINARGRLAASLMGAWLTEQGLRPDAALVSSAVRTRQTWARVAPMLETAPEADFADALYLADVSRMLAVLQGAGQAQTVLMLGHNPGMEAAVKTFCTPPRPCAMPTCAAAVIRFPVKDWAQAQFEGGTLATHVTPKALV